MKKSPTAPGMGRRILRLTGTLLTTALVLAVLAAAAAWKFQELRYVPILTGSMAPDIPQGSLVVTKPITHEQVKEGMAIAFMPPEPWTPKDGNPVVHRVLKITKADHGQQLTLETKGDHNDSQDPWKINLNFGGGSYAEVVTTIPKAGSMALTVNRFGVPGVAAVLAGLLLIGYGIRQLRATLRYQSANRHRSPAEGPRWRGGAGPSLARHRRPRGKAAPAPADQEQEQEHDSTIQLPAIAPEAPAKTGGP